MGFFSQLVLAIILLQNPSGYPTEPQPAPCPELPRFVWNACPFEGCTYREWTAAEAVPVYDTWKGTRQQIAQLAVRGKVFAITGVVITKKPGVIRVDEDMPERKLKKGDIILTYTYHGEGDSEACFQGRYYPHFDIRFSKSADGSSYVYVDPGKKEWWAKVRLKSGRTGWVDMNRYKFSNVDRYG
jgi:hypothetical protein